MGDWGLTDNVMFQRCIVIEWHMYSMMSTGLNVRITLKAKGPPHEALNNVYWHSKCLTR